MEEGAAVLSGGNFFRNFFHDTDGAMTGLLIIDDDAKLSRLLAEYFEAHGFAVETAPDGKQGLEMATSGRFDAVMLDLMLPEMDGCEVLRRLRAVSDVPVLMLTGRGEEADRIVGLELGADDYVPKTFSSRELLARLRAILRRSQGQVQQSSQAGQPAAGHAAIPSDAREPIRIGDLEIDPGARQVTVSGQLIPMTKVEFDLVHALARGRGLVKSRETLLDEVAGRQFDVFDRSVDVHIASVRRKLNDDPKSPQYIETVRGAGYVMR